MVTTTQLPVLSELVRVLASAPSPEEIMAIKASKEEELRLTHLMEKLNSSSLSYEEKKELDMFLLAEHLVEVAKIEAYVRMRA